MFHNYLSTKFFELYVKIRLKYCEDNCYNNFH